MNFPEFSITQRHYNLIINQVQKNYPYESGGFVGGKDYTITAVHPVFNQDYSNKTDIFAMSSVDIERAHLFFAKHGLTYYGSYHSHPKGAAIPSQQDLTHIQKYLFIISLRDFHNPDFAAYQVIGHQRARRVPLNVVSDTAFSVKNIRESQANNPALNVRHADFNDPDLLNQHIDNVFNRNPTYQKDARRNDDSGEFSTLA